MPEGFHPLTYLSICSGIEAASVAWGPLGWQPVGFAEIDKFPSAVLAHHYPGVKNYGDFTKITLDDLPCRPDILVGGTPCQSFSVAGLRAGLADPRGNLTLEFARLAERLRTRWLVWENVPGVLSIDGGRTFGAFIGALGEIGYGFAYRVFDAQYAGVPQRRRRVFLVGHLGDWRRAAAVLFERQSLSGDTPPSREKRESAPTTPSRRSAGGGLGTDFDCDGGLVPQAFGGNNTGGPIDVATACNAHGGPNGRLDFESETFVTGCLNANGKAAGSATLQDAETGMLVTHSLRADGFDASEDGTGRGTPLVPVVGDFYEHFGREEYERFGRMVPLSQPEEWKPIVGWDRYEISNLGRVRNSSKEILKPGFSTKGYRHVTLYRNDERRTCKVHHLVLNTFVGPRPPRHVAAHEDRNRSNNTLLNLRWATNSENQQDAVKHGTSPGFQKRGEGHHNAKLNMNQIETIKRLHRAGKSYTEISAEFEVYRSHIRNIVMGKRWASSEPICFSCKDSGADSGEIAPTLRSMNFAGSHANAGGQVAVAFTTEQTPKFNADCALTITKQSPTGGGQPQCVAIAIQERAICENPLAGPDGVGIRTDDQAYTVEARQVPQAVAFVQNTRDEVRLMGGDGQSVGALAAEPGMKQQTRDAETPRKTSVIGGQGSAMQVRRLTPL